MENGYKKDLVNCRILVGLKGGEFTCVDKSGEIQWSVGLQGGVHFPEQLADMMKPGEQFSLSGSITVMKRGDGRVVAQGFGKDALRSDANPDFVGRPLSPAEVRLNNEVAKARRFRKESERDARDIKNLLAKEKRREAEEKLQVPPATKEEVTPEVTEEPETVEAKVTEGGEA